MQSVALELSTVNNAVLVAHFTLRAHIIPPQTREHTAISPGDRSLAVSLASFPHAFVGSLFEFTAVRALQTIHILHGSVAAWSTILEGSAEFITVFVINHAQTKQRNHTVSLTLKKLTYRDGHS